MSLYVGNLPYSTTEEDFEKMFSKFGPIKNVKIATDRVTGRSKGYGFVNYRNNEDDHKGLEMHEEVIGGRILTVRIQDKS